MQLDFTGVSRLTKSAAKIFADALYMPIRLGNITTGRTRVHLKALGGSFPFPLEIVDEFGNPGKRGADAGLLLRGPGSIAVFIGRSCESPGASTKEKQKERLDFMVLDARVVEEKTGALEGSFQACDITTVNGFFKDFASAVKKAAHRKSEGVKWR
jgi:hypothetical protein